MAETIITKWDLIKLIREKCGYSPSGELDTDIVILDIEVSDSDGADTYSGDNFTMVINYEEK